jgi:hypothetical protein
MISADQVRVAGAGHVYVAPAGTALPTDLSALSGDWVDAGYVTTDGVSFTFSRETEDLDAWQGDKIRVLSTREPASLSLTLMQTNSDVMVLAFGGGTITEPSPDVYRYEPTPGDNLVRSIVIEFTDEGMTYRYLIPRAQIEGDVTFTLTRAGAVLYPLNLGLLDATPKFAIVSNDPAMASGSLPGTIGGGSGGSPANVIINATEPSTSGVAVNSVWIDSDDNSIFLFSGTAWVDTTFDLLATPGDGTIGSVNPATAGVSGTEDDVFFRNTGSIYQTFVKGAGGDNDWTDAGINIDLY